MCKMEVFNFYILVLTNKIRVDNILCGPQQNPTAFNLRNYFKEQAFIQKKN